MKVMLVLSPYFGVKGSTVPNTRSFPSPTKKTIAEHFLIFTHICKQGGQIQGSLLRLTSNYYQNKIGRISLNIRYSRPRGEGLLPLHPACCHPRNIWLAVAEKQDARLNGHWSDPAEYFFHPLQLKEGRSLQNMQGWGRGGKNSFSKDVQSYSSNAT